MTRLAILLALSAAAVAWLLRRPAPVPAPPWVEDEDGVQWDPWTRGMTGLARDDDWLRPPFRVTGSTHPVHVTTGIRQSGPLGPAA